MLRPNNFLDFINITLIFVFIILFYFVFTVIVFANPYFWVIKISVHFFKIMEEKFLPQFPL